VPTWEWFYAATFIVVAVAIGFSILTARLIRRELDAPPGIDPIDPGIIGMSRRSLYANATLSQAFLLAILTTGFSLAGVTIEVIGLPGAVDVSWAIALGVGLGFALAGVNEGMERLFDLVGITYDDALRRLLSPTTATEWAALCLVVLPTVALFEEVLFRGVLIGGLSVGLAISPWVLVIISSVLFAMGHGLQGPGGLLAAGILGFVLAVSFVVTESLLLVIVAHYVVNLTEFVRQPPSG